MTTISSWIVEHGLVRPVGSKFKRAGRQPIGKRTPGQIEAARQAACDRSARNYQRRKAGT